MPGSDRQDWWVILQWDDKHTVFCLSQQMINLMCLLYYWGCLDDIYIYIFFSGTCIFKPLCVVEANCWQGREGAMPTLEMVEMQWGAVSRAGILLVGAVRRAEAWAGPCTALWWISTSCASVLVLVFKKPQTSAAGCQCLDWGCSRTCTASASELGGGRYRWVPLSRDSLVCQAMAGEGRHCFSLLHGTEKGTRALGYLWSRGKECFVLEISFPVAPQSSGVCRNSAGYSSFALKYVLKC